MRRTEGNRSLVTGEPVRVVDGPTDKPNFVRRVIVEREADLPQFFRCRDAETGQAIIVHRSKLEIIVK